jgi:hypothetical protein
MGVLTELRLLRLSHRTKTACGFPAFSSPRSASCSCSPSVAFRPSSARCNALSALRESPFRSMSSRSRFEDFCSYEATVDAAVVREGTMC